MMIASPREAAVDDQAERVERAVRYMAEHYPEPIDLDRLASVACLSRFHFSRVFSAHRGLSPMEELSRIRVERAAELLRTGRQRVADVAFACGYGSLSAFNAAFKARTGLAPGAYRRKKSKEPEVSRKRPVEPAAPRGQAEDTEFARRVLSMNVEVVGLPELDVAMVSKTGSLLDTRAAWDALLRWAGPKGLLVSGQSFIGIPEDDPFLVPADACRFHACVSLPPGFPKEPGPVEYGHLAGGLHAAYRFHDTPDRIPFAYRVVMQEWLPRSGHRLDPARPCLEFSLNDPAQDPEGKASVRICVPITAGEDGR